MKKKHLLIILAAGLLTAPWVINAARQSIAYKNHSEVVLSAQSQPVILGYCPTMAQYLYLFADLELLEVEVQLFSSSADVLAALHNNTIDLALIGRKAYHSELTAEIREVQLQEGYTLITQNGGVIKESELNNFIVHTYLKPEIAQEILADHPQINYYDSLAEILEFESRQGLSQSSSTAILISWADFDDEFKLLTLINQGQKVSIFRTPFVYFRQQDELADKIVSLINN